MVGTNWRIASKPARHDAEEVERDADVVEALAVIVVSAGRGSDAEVALYAQVMYES